MASENLMTTGFRGGFTAPSEPSTHLNVCWFILNWTHGKHISAIRIKIRNVLVNKLQLTLLSTYRPCPMRIYDIIWRQISRSILRSKLVSCRRPAITWTNMGFILVRLCGFHLEIILLQVAKPLLRTVCLEILLLDFIGIYPGVQWVKHFFPSGWVRCGFSFKTTAWWGCQHTCK